MQVLAPLTRPSWFESAVSRSGLRGGLLAVVAAGLASAGISLAADALAHASQAAVDVSLALPVLFLGYWLLQAFCVDAAAGMVGRSGRRRLLLAVSGHTFPAWIAYALLGLAEALALHSGSASGRALASALQWGTLPVLAWFLTLSVLAIRAVYRLSAMTAFAFALLPYAMLTAALLVVGLAFGALHSAGAV